MINNFRRAFMCISTLVFMSCGDSIDDANKRNENWSWWVDHESGKGQWIPIGGENPVKNGSYTLFYCNGKIYKKGKLLNGKQLDTAYYNDIKGNPHSYTFAVGDSIHHRFIKDGYNVQHDQLGKVKGKGIVKDHVFGDKWTTYYENGKIRVLQNLENDTGWVTTYYENGNVKDSSYQFKKGRLIQIKTWYKGGKISSINDYKSANLMGIVKLFYENGVVRDSGLVVNGLAEGKVVKRFENGQIQFITHMKKNKPHGFQQAFYDNGQVKLEVYMKDNLAHGELKEYDESGKLIRHAIYNKGALIETK